MKKSILIPVFVCVLTVWGAAQERGLRIMVEEELGPQVQIGKQWAVFIAIDRYREWAPLVNPVKDAHEIRGILTENYFVDELRELYNTDATAANIRRLFSDLRRDVQINDSVFVFYAGHGHTDDLTRTGSWIPTDGGKDEMAQANWLPNIQIRNMLSALSAKHVFLVADACFSGDILDISRGASPEINSEYYKRAYGRVSRQVMTSGASETVPDSSEFALRLKSSLLRADRSYVDPEYLFSNVREVRSTQPLLGVIRGTEHQDGGSFIFFRRPETLAAAPIASAGERPSSPATPSAPAVAPLPPAQGQARPGQPSPAQKDKSDLSHSVSWSVGALVGSSFSTPMVTAAITATLPMPVIPYTFFGIGCDGGFVDGTSHSDKYYSIYPFAHYNFFWPFIDGKITPYIGAGAGYMIANYTFPKDTVTSNLFAFDAVAGMKLLGFIDLVYSLRVSSGGAAGRLAAGVYFRFGN